MMTFTVLTVTIGTGERHTRIIRAATGFDVLNSSDIPDGERGVYVLSATP
jgi:hypothetical protein